VKLPTGGTVRDLRCVSMQCGWFGATPKPTVSKPTACKSGWKKMWL